MTTPSNMNHTFTPFPKIPRLNRTVRVTEKLDGTNASIKIVDPSSIMEGETPVATVGGVSIFAGSRNRWITPDNDNYGFARWVLEHADEIATLKPGLYFGEWWGNGIQRGYGLKEKRLSLFNTAAFALHGETPLLITENSPTGPRYQQVLPPCIGLVPVLGVGHFCTDWVAALVARLSEKGSVAAPGFMNPEGVIVYHEAAGVSFKVTVKDDEKGKGQ